MRIPSSRRRFTLAAAGTVLGAGVGFGQNQSKGGASGSDHVQSGVYYFSGMGANSSYPKDDQVTVADPFEKHAARAMEGVKRSLERAGCTMESLLQVQVFTCLPHSDKAPVLSGQAKVDAYNAQYQAFNKVYRGFFSGKTPARAFMSVDWIPGNSLVEIVGCARVVNPPK
jgi:enamine deaminase RidA (YjgF/YER057c/UK114 family)